MQEEQWTSPFDLQSKAWSWTKAGVDYYGFDEFGI